MNRAGEEKPMNDDDENDAADEVFTDEQLNEIISRNEEEYELFQKID